ncbi:pectin methyl-esterase inhibitor 13 [Hibiscus trionum]|uniref:pectinesterase n=1 Tax=Hibiscus trionum TaxID=183268 RepID=A0A9W7HDV5_HIBTR|nr:pectin methyl-esterase inhibitor 13 [Hibiscus trionum]
MATISFNHSLQFLVVVLALNSLINISLGGRQIEPNSSTEFIKTSCSSTTYPDLCCQTLLDQASEIQTSPQLIAHAALNVTLSDVKSATESLAKLSKIHGLPPRAAQAMQGCLKELSESVEELRKSVIEMDKIKSSNFRKMISDIRSWVSAALTDESTCTDGIEGENISSDEKTSVRSQILTIAHLTSNALALVEDYASLSHQG